MRCLPCRTVPDQGVKPSTPYMCKRTRRGRYCPFFGNTGCGDMPFDDNSETAGPEAGFLAFGFFGSRLPRFIPLAIEASCAFRRERTHFRHRERSEIGTFVRA